MYETIKVKKAEIRPILEASFPQYAGRRFEVVLAETCYLSDTYWSGGTRSQYVFVPMDGRNVRKLDSLQNPWESKVEGSTVKMSVDFVIVEHSVFCGQDMGIKIHAHPDMIKRLSGK